MNTQDLTAYLDELMFSKTGKHLDSLQVSILRGVLNGKKYATIAQEYNCSAGYAKDEAYKLWRLLSDTLEEDINKANFRATIERITAKNSQFVGNIKIDKLNFCPNPYSDLEENDDIIRDDRIIAHAIEKKIKRETVPRLAQLGLTTEQISEVLELSILEVSKIVASQTDRT